MSRPSMDGKRVHVMLTSPQLKHLASQARKTGLTVSDLIRRAVDAMVFRDKKAATK
jgi:hypothetical protein